MNKLTEIYTAVLASVGAYVDADGLVSIAPFPSDDEKTPFTVGGKRLVVPSKRQLNMTDWSNRVAFHPLVQNVVGGESPVMEALRRRATTYMSWITGFYFFSLATLAVDTAKHPDLTPAQAAWLAPFSDGDKSLLKTIESIIGLNKLTFRNKCEFIRFKIIKGRVWNGQKRSRVAIAHFPLYEELTSDDFDRTFCGINLRVKDVKMLRAMYEKLFPGIADTGTCEFGTDSVVAPSLEALMQVYGRMATDLNNAAVQLQGVIKGAEDLVIPLDWIDTFNNLQSIQSDIRKVPMLDGNDGRVRTDNAQSMIAVESTPPAPMTAAHQTSSAATSVPVLKENINMTPVKQPAVRQPMRVGITEEEARQRGIIPPAPLGAHHPFPHQAQPRTFTQIVQPVTENLYAAREREVAERAKQAQAFQMQQMQQQQAAQQAAQNTELPKGSRMINGSLYVPAPQDASGAVPPNAVFDKGVLFIPYGNRVAAPANQMAMGVGIHPQQMQQNVLGGMQQQAVNPFAGATPEMIANALINGQITPAQVGMDDATYQMMAQNPVMLVTYIRNIQGASVTSALGQQAANPVAQLPRYLRNTLAEAQSNAMMQQQQMRMGQFMPGQQFIRV